MFAESIGLNPDKVLSREAMSKSHKTIIDSEKTQIEILNKALKQSIIKELQST